MNRSKRFVPLPVALALAVVTASAGSTFAQQGPPPDNGGGMGGPGVGGDMGPPGGGGGPPDPVEMQQRRVRSLQRKLGVDAATFATLRPEIEKIVQLEAAVESTSRPERPARRRGEGDDDGPPDRQGGGGGNDNGGGRPAGHRGGGRGRFGQADGQDRAQASVAPDGADSADADLDPAAADLIEKVRNLRSALAPADDRDGDQAPATDAELADDLKAVRAARDKVAAELAAARKTLRPKVKSPRQEAVLVATGILD